MPSAAPARVTRVESPPRFSGTGSGERGKRPSVSRLIPATSHPRRSSSARMTGPPAPRTASRATVNFRFRIRSTSTAGSLSTASRCRSTAPSSVVTFPVLPPPPPSSPPRSTPPPSSSPVLPHQLQHPRAIRSVQEDPVRADELQGIPLYWVVTGRDGDPAAGRVVLDRQLHRGGRNQTDFHDGAPHGTQPVDHRPLERRPRLPGIPSDHHHGLPRLRPAAEGPGVAPDDLVGQVLSHDASNARDTDHQRVGHCRQF